VAHTLSLLQEKLEEQESEAQLELMEEKLRLAESELQCALHRAEQAEKRSSQLVSKGDNTPDSMLNQSDKCKVKLINLIRKQYLQSVLQIEVKYC
jgi:hypothetical protein